MHGPLYAQAAVLETSRYAEAVASCVLSQWNSTEDNRLLLCQVLCLGIPLLARQELAAKSSQ